MNDYEQEEITIEVIFSKLARKNPINFAIERGGLRHDHVHLYIERSSWLTAYMVDCIE